jgi:protein transport protein SEC61 subunit gamma-like protein
MREFLQNCKRLLQIARKPGSDEYTKIAKISGLGFILIGLLGFIIMYLATIIQGV